VPNQSVQTLDAHGHSSGRDARNLVDWLEPTGRGHKVAITDVCLVGRLVGGSERLIDSEAVLQLGH
jgi:hypothetical protein